MDQIVILARSIEPSVHKEVTDLNNYEVILMFYPDAESERRVKQYERLKGIIAEGGVIKSEDEWGTRKLAYPINDETEGVYTVISFTSGPDFPAELDRVYKITDGVLRTMIVAKPEEAETEAK